MGESGERLDQEGDAERRIARARSAIGRSFEELIARGESGGRAPSIPSSGSRPVPVPPPDIEAQPQVPVTPPAVPDPSAADPTRVDEIAAAVERRVSTWVDGRVRAAERRLELQAEAFEVGLGEGAAGSPQATEQVEEITKSLAAAEDQRAAIEARFVAAEATLRSRLDAAVDEHTGEQDRRMREEAAAQRKRINEELAASLQGTAAELRRQLGTEREGARREFSQVARDEINAAVDRLDQLHSAAVRDAREAAEVVATSRLSDAQAQMSRQFEASRAESREAIERGLGGVDSRLRELFEGLRSEQEAVGSAREVEFRRRTETRVDELAVGLSERLDREVDRRLREAQAELERVNAEAVERARIETRTGVEATISREVVKGEARLAAASQRIDLIAQQAAEIDGVVRGAAESAISTEAERVKAQLERAASEAVGVHANAFREELSTVSYRDHSRRAEAAATAQLARSLDALKAQRSALAAELAEAGAAERQGVAAERTRIETELAQSVTEARGELDQRAAELRAAAEAAVARRADEALSSEFESRAAELERRLEALAVRSEKESFMRFSTAASDAEARLAAVEHAQQREEQVRLRINAAEREAEQRVRQAEQRLVDVLAKIDLAQSR